MQREKFHFSDLFFVLVRLSKMNCTWYQSWKDYFIFRSFSTMLCVVFLNLLLIVHLLEQSIDTFFLLNTCLLLYFVMAECKAPIVDSDHPLLLHPSDTTGQSLVYYRSQVPKITQSGVEWRRSVFLPGTNWVSSKETLRRRILMSVHHLWDRYNSYAFAWIMNVVSIEVLSSNIYSDSALHVWTSLKERFDKVNGSRIYQLHREISISQQGIDSVTDYFNKLRLL